MISTIEKLSAIPRDSSAFNTGMLDVNGRAVMLKENIMDATPYMYVSYWNIILAVAWIGVIVAIFSRAKAQKGQAQAGLMPILLL